jgi:DHA2 family multidrug resistance protein
VLQNRQIYHLDHIAGNINYASTSAVNMIHYGERLFIHNGSSPGLAHQQALALINGFAQSQMVIFSFDDAFWLLGVFAILGVICASLLKSVKSTGNKPVVMLD